jgi:monofunctional chorismate mutase
VTAPRTDASAAPRVGYQGAPGAYSETAAGAVCPAAEPSSYGDFASLLAALAAGDVEWAVLPVENTTAGAIGPALDALASTPSAHVVGEVVVPVRHCLLAIPGATLEGIRRVRSHPAALAQCGAFLRAHPEIDAEVAWDTAGSAKDVAETGDPTVAAIASREAGARYGLEPLLDHGVADDAENATRFWLLSRHPAPPPRGAGARTALLVPVADAPGALRPVLSAVEDDAVDLRRIESRPAGPPWRHYLLLELAHRTGAAEPLLVLARVRAVAPAARVVGTWRAAERPEAEPTPPAATEAAPAPPAVWAVRGATTTQADEKVAVREAVRELLGEVMRRNGLRPADLVSVFFTATTDLTSEFPAIAARELGWTDVPLLCASEIAVPGALPRCLRVMLHVHGPPPATGARHVYLRDAAALRPDLT